MLNLQSELPTAYHCSDCAQINSSKDWPKIATTEIVKTKETTTVPGIADMHGVLGERNHIQHSLEKNILYVELYSLHNRISYKPHAIFINSYKISIAEFMNVLCMLKSERVNFELMSFSLPSVIYIL